MDAFIYFNIKREFDDNLVVRLDSYSKRQKLVRIVDMKMFVAKPEKSHC